MNNNWNPSRLDLVKEKIGFGSAIQNQIEAKFLLQAEGRSKVLMTLGVDEQRGLFIENINEDIELEI